MQHIIDTLLAADQACKATHAAGTVLEWAIRMPKAKRRMSDCFHTLQAVISGQALPLELGLNTHHL